MIQPLWRTVWRFLKKLGIKLPYDPAIPQFRKTHVPSMFTTALCTIARTWKQPRCPLINESIKKMWYIYTTEYHSALKRNEFESVLVRWINLEPVTQSEVSQKEKNKHSILMHIYGI